MLGFVEFANVVRQEQGRLATSERSDKDRIATLLEHIGLTLDQVVQAYVANDNLQFHRACEQLWLYLWLGRDEIMKVVMPPLSLRLADRLTEAGRDWDIVGPHVGQYSGTEPLENVLARLSRASGFLTGAAVYLRASPNRARDRLIRFAGRVRSLFWKRQIEAAKGRELWPYDRSDGFPDAAHQLGSSRMIWSRTARRYISQDGVDPHDPMR